MANIGKWIVNVIAVFDEKKVVTSMAKLGTKSAAKFADKFNKVTGSKLPTSISGAISQGIGVALSQADNKLKQYKDLADKIMGKEQNIDQVSLETGVNGSVLESLGRLQEIKGGDTSDILGVFQNINKDLMSGQSQLGGKDTLDAFNKILDRVFAEKDPRRRGMIADQLGVGELKGMLLGSSKEQIQAQLKGLGSAGGGVINDRSFKQKEARENLERVKRDAQMLDIKQRDIIEGSTGQRLTDKDGKDKGLAFDQIMLREQMKANQMLKDSVDNLSSKVNLAEDMDNMAKNLNIVGEKLVSGLDFLVEKAKEIPFIGKYIKALLEDKKTK